MDTGGMPGSNGPSAGEDGGDAPDPLLGRNVGRKFVLEKLLGEGAMGSVYRARQTALEKVVAIKVMKGDLARDPMFAARFHREAKAASRLDHPNSIRILDYGQDDDGLLYIAMEFLDGRDLSHLLAQEWPLSSARTVDLMSQALGAIAVAHDLGITHRDLKPENIMVLRRRTDDAIDIDVVKVCDFGIAKLVDASDDAAQPGTSGKGKLTTAGLVIGTPAYMSPEQGRGEPIDGRSDLYSMGVILFQCLTGELPFDAPSAIGLVVKHQTEPVPPPSSVRAGVDPRLEAICLKALSKRREDRYQTARDFRAALKAGDGVTAPLTTGEGFSSVPRAVPSDHEVGVARTELQLSAVATAPTGLALPSGAFDTQKLVEGRAPEPTARGKSAWTMGVVAAAILASLGGFLVTQSRRVAPPPPVAETAQANPTTPVATPPANVSVRSPEPAQVASAVIASSPPVESAQRAESTVSHRGGAVTATIRGASVTARAPSERAHDEPPPAPEVPAIAPPAPPPVTAVALPPVVAPALATPPPPPAFDVASATVTMGGAGHLENIASRYVNDAVGRLKGTIKGCYVRGLPSLTGSLEGAGMLHIETDDSGTIVAATVSGPVRGDVGKCIEDAVRGVRIDGVDTGAARADIPLEFKAR